MLGFNKCVSDATEAHVIADLMNYVNHMPQHHLTIFKSLRWPKAVFFFFFIDKWHHTYITSY